MKRIKNFTKKAFSKARETTGDLFQLLLILLIVFIIAGVLIFPFLTAETNKYTDAVESKGDAIINYTGN